MSDPMPQRSEPQQNETVSRRAFGVVLPKTWEFRDMHNEFGIDGHVEIFEGKRATGLLFNVQLKSTIRSSYDKVRIETSTRNYWKELDMPTLVVLVDAGGTIHYGWSHQWDIYGRKKNAKSYTFTLPHTWGPNSVAEIEREVRAARAARFLRKSLPIYWTLSTAEGVPLSWANRLRAALERDLESHRELTRREDAGGAAALEISVAGNAVSVRLHGTPGGVLHYNGVSVDAMPVEAIAADIMLGLAMEVERGGLDTLSIALIEGGIADSAMLGVDPDLTAYAAHRVAETGRVEAALSMVEHVYFNEGRKYRELVSFIFVREPGRLGTDAAARIAERIAELADEQARDGPAASYLYNAAHLIKDSNPARGAELLDRAAVRRPKYHKRGFWWQERGAMHFDGGNPKGALGDYQQAVKLRDKSAIPLLADTYCTLGQYDEAIATWKRMRTERYIWLLKMWALQNLVQELGIHEQVRDPEAAEALFNTDAPGVDVVRLDLLHYYGHWRAGAQYRISPGEGYTPFYVAAACFARTIPLLWFEALIAAQKEVQEPREHFRLTTLIILAAIQETGEGFRQFVLEDEFVNESDRPELLALIDAAPPMERPLYMRSRGRVKRVKL